MVLLLEESHDRIVSRNRLSARWCPEALHLKRSKLCVCGSIDTAEIDLFGLVGVSTAVEGVRDCPGARAFLCSVLALLFKEDSKIDLFCIAELGTAVGV